MNTLLHNLSLRSLLRAAILGIVLFGGILVHSVDANTRVIGLDICNQEGFCNNTSLQVLVGQQVTLRWFIEGYDQCRLYAGGTLVTNIDTTVQPATGETSYTPASGEQTSFSINCDGIVEFPPDQLPPTVSISIDGPDTKTYDPFQGGVPIRVRWTSTDATRCDPWLRAPVSDPGNVSTLPIQFDNLDVGKTSGNIWFDLPIPLIQESTIFSITCENENTGETASDSVTLTVLDAPAPIPLSTSQSTNGLLESAASNTYRVNRDPINGYGYVSIYPRVSTQLAYPRFCYYKSYDEAGNPIPNPPGYGTSATNLNPNFSVTLTRTTIFELVCRRPQVTIGAATYPEDWSTTTTRVNVNDEGSDALEGDIPPVTVSITPLPGGDLTAEKSPYTGYAYKQFYVRAENAEYCSFEAYRNPDNTSFYNLDAWSSTRRDTDAAGVLDGFFGAPDLTQDTNFVVKCQRSFDRQYFASNTPEYAAAYAEDTVRITVLDAPTFVNEPEMIMFANPRIIDADLMWSSRTAVNGFWYQNNATRFFGSQRYLYNNLGVGATSSITFPFSHPTGEYDILFAHCDEADGESPVRLLVNGVEVGNYLMDSPYQEWDGCGTLEYFFGKIADSVTLNTGDSITLECRRDGGEPCRIERMIFGQQGNVLLTRTAGQTEMPVDIYYNSHYATACRGQWATPSGEPSYRWTTDSWRDMRQRVNISTTTEFTAECYRGDASVPATDNITVFVPEFVSFTAQVSVAAGECFYNGLPVGLPYSIGDTIDAPDGFIADTTVGSPTYGSCIPAVDLAALSPSANISGPGVVTDNVNGTYDGIDILVAIENLGPGALPASSNISYSAQMGFPQFALPTSTSAIGFYNLAIAEPNPSPNQSAALTRTMNSVPFGTHLACARVNLDNSPDNYPESSSDFGNNISCTSVTLPVPPPPMTLSSDRTTIRQRQTVDIDWGINITYEMSCVVRGPGGLNVSFNTLTDPLTGTYTTQPLTSTSEFIFQCTEPITGTSFTERIRVDMIEEQQEI